MSDNYFQVTVTPDLPKEFFLEKEIKFLEACGMTVEPVTEYVGNGKYHSTDYYYLYAAENLDLEGDSTLDQIYDEDEDAPDLQIDAEIESWTAAKVLQNVLNRSEGRITEIVMEGAFTGSKMKQGEFGGQITRITSQHIQEGGTSQLLDWFRANEGKELPYVPS